MRAVDPPSGLGFRPDRRKLLREPPLSSVRGAVPSAIRSLGEAPPPIVFPSEVDDILHVVVAVCIALIIVLIVDQWLMGAVLSDWLF